MNKTQFKCQRTEQGTFASLFWAHKQICETKDEELIMCLIRDLADFAGSPRQLELFSDEELWEYLTSYEQAFKDEQSKLKEFCLL